MPKRITLLWAAACLLATATAAVGDPVIVSRATDGTAGNGPSITPSMSADGRFVAFVSFASNLVAGDTNGVEEVFLRDRDTDADGVFDEPGAVSTVRVSQRPGVQGNGPSHEPVITPDGRYVVFTTFASSFFAVGQPMLPFAEVMRWDRLTGELILVSRTSAGDPLDGACTGPVVTADGNTIYFRTTATNVDGAAVGSGGLIVRRDVTASQLTRVSAATGSAVSDPSVSDDGTVVVYSVGSNPGTITVLRPGLPTVTYAGRSPKLSRNGRFVVAVDDTQSPEPVFRLHLASGERRAVPAAGGSATRLFVSSTGRYVAVNSLLLDFTYLGIFLEARSGDVLAYDAQDTSIAYALAEFINGGVTYDVAVLAMAEVVDVGGDGIDDAWRALFLPNVGGPEAGPAGDPDTDGLTNAQELARGSHPNGTNAAYLAEGVSSADFFTTQYALVNPGASPVSAAVRLERGNAADAVKLGFSVPGRGRITLNSHELGLDTSSFSAAIESGGRLIVDRLVTWGNPGEVPYGSHGETASAGPGTQWFLAEGSTVLGFQLFYLLQNPQDVAATATVRFLLPFAPPMVRTYDLPAHSRTTIYVNTIPGLEATDVSADVSATQPIAVERAMYRSAAGQVFALGHAAAAVAAPATEWFFAEGATGDFFDTYLLFANPSAQPAHVQVQYLRDAGGAVTHAYTVPPNSRFTVFVDAEAGVTTTNFGARVTSDVGIVAERSMYWPGGFSNYYEGHVSAGATATSSLWYLAECEIGGAGSAETYVLIANTGAAPATFGVHLLSESGRRTGFDRVITLAGNTRISLPMSAFPSPAGNPAPGRYGVEVFEDVTSTHALVVEGALYWSLPGQPFAAGANWPATHVP